MAIHHDSHAYGNLKKTSGEMSENELLNMLSKLNQAPSEEEKKEDTSKKEGKKE